MGQHNNVEIMIFANHSLTSQHKKELAKWLITALQPVIEKQQTIVKKIFLKFWQQTPAIYLS